MLTSHLPNIKETKYMLLNRQTLATLSEYDFFKAHPNVSFPSPLTDEVLAPFDHAVLTLTPQPEFDGWTHELFEGKPEYRDGKWYQTWVLTPVTHTPEENAERLLQRKEQKVAQIDAQTSSAIMAGFECEATPPDTNTPELLHFSYDSFDQQNFADAAVSMQLATASDGGIPTTTPWNAYRNHTADSKGDLVILQLTAETFLPIYAAALNHKATKMAEGGQRKAAVAAAQTVEDVGAI